MIRDDSDRSWESWGRQDPYYGVLTDDRYRRENLDDRRKLEFMETGRLHIGRVLGLVEQRFGAMSSTGSALDFGCGVGRVLVSLSGVFRRVIGVDVSEAMLKVAGENCAERGIQNVELCPSDDDLSQVEGSFDFIHSYLVFQHIPVRRAERILGRLVDRLNDGGILAVQLPFLIKASKLRRAIHVLRRNFLPFSHLVNIAAGRRWSEPFMQMNTYDMNRVLSILSEQGARDMFVHVFEEGRFVSAFVVARKAVHPEVRRG